MDDNKLRGIITRIEYELEDDPKVTIESWSMDFARRLLAAADAEAVPEQPVADFNRELRYIVIKVKDALAYLPTHKRIILDSICDEIARGRAFYGKPQLNAVVVEQDWPEYEPTWAAIQARMTGAAAPDVRVLVEALRKIARQPQCRVKECAEIAEAALAEWEAKR